MKISEENRDKGVPRVSTVIFPGQSHISSGMTVLMQITSGKSDNRDVRLVAQLESVLHYSHGSF
jgi:hypothetical protein